MHTHTAGEAANAQNHINLLWHCANTPKRKAGTHGFRSLRRSSKTTLVKFWKGYGCSRTASGAIGETRSATSESHVHLSSSGPQPRSSIASLEVPARFLFSSRAQKKGPVRSNSVFFAHGQFSLRCDLRDLQNDAPIHFVSFLARDRLGGARQNVRPAPVETPGPRPIPEKRVA